ncbi:TPA: hypothetical protein QDC27_004787 [Burkholderia cepacia ATCC 25416]|uniref:hypothetical protein n=1 Tax=Burkholderia cepacia TaxID=292 RepID=UPI001CF2FF8B|nr:hypothetical protein [Burkholderia cepacia]HDR9769523.1 hypothetical protein [Burkholderia cepacia ATCC 25416]MCA8076555.1 hypothetical protein [Burkholderia cepacia]HDR9776963.1 hypothetical protein [Burkholderia cepacia ATCC 25416]HDR9780371.1 hypothetical protein [Burkholderia cepacia ATCC 25416]HDR9788098.1 hypothetical protein [Burkholderia cepacia ATCC 25416]
MTALQARHFIRANVKGCVVQRIGRQPAKKRQPTIVSRLITLRTIPTKAKQ